MGRLATYIAAVGTSAENLPPIDRTPIVSVLDVLLPRRGGSTSSCKRETSPPLCPQRSHLDKRHTHTAAITATATAMFTLIPFGLFRPKIYTQLINSNTGKPLDPNASDAVMSYHTDIKRDKNGKMMMVRHKNKSTSTFGGRDNGHASGERHNGGKNNQDDATKTWTPAEDAKLHEMKAASKSWKDIEAEFGCPLWQLKAHWKEIEGKVGNNNSQNNDDGSKPWTPADDAKLEEMKAENKTWKQIEEELGRERSDLQARFKEINGNAAAGGGGGGNNEGKGGKNKNNQNNDAKKDEGGKGEDFTAEDDAKIKELLAAGEKNFKRIADALGRKTGKPLTERINKLKAEGGDSGDKGGNQKNQEGGGGKGKKNKGGDNGGQKSQEKEKEKTKGSKDKNKQERPSKPASNALSHRSEVKFTMREWMTLQEDDLFSFGELQLLAELVGQEGRDVSWLAVASRFMDKTGRRMHPEDIREKFEQMAAMQK